MTARDVRRFCPRIWDHVQAGVYDDLRLQKKIHKFEMTEKAARVIAHNAALFAVYELHNLIMGK